MSSPLITKNTPGQLVHVSRELAHTAVTTTGVDITSEASGPLMLQYIGIANSGAAVASTTNNLNLTSDNDFGTATVLTSTAGGVTTSALVSSSTSYVLESGKKLSLAASTSALTSTGTIKVDAVFVRLSDGANVVAAS